MTRVVPLLLWLWLWLWLLLLLLLLLVVMVLVAHAASCRSDGLAQQVLTAAAKLRGQRDPALALACAGLLLALASDDALPAYLSSSAAAVLASQLLQVLVCDSDCPCTCAVCVVWGNGWVWVWVRVWVGAHAQLGWWVGVRVCACAFVNVCANVCARERT